MLEESTTTARVVLPADFRSRGLKPTTLHVLNAALERGKISTREIAHLIPKDIERDREKLTEVIGWLNGLIKSRQTELVTDKDEPAHRQQYPIVRVNRVEFQHVGNGKVLPVRKDRPLPIDRLESEGNKFERDALAFYYAEIRRYPLLSFDDEQVLGRRMLEDRDLEARNKLVEHNLRLVRWIARKYAWSQIDFEDLVQEGNMGLLTAADKYDYRVGRFATYATWWVRQAITRMIMDYGTIIRLPVHLQELRRKILKASREVAAKVGRVPTIEEIAARAQIASEKIRRTMLSVRIETVSLDDVQRSDGRGTEGEGDGPTIAESVPDDRIISPDIYIEACQELEAARKRLNDTLQEITGGLQLSGRDQDIFNSFYGFDGSGKRRTLEVVGQHHGVTRERVRQIIARIWQRIDEKGGNMDHCRLLEEQARIDELEKIVGPGTS